MSGQRFHETDENSFFGRFLYDRVVPADHFLRRLLEIIPWERFTKMLLEYYRGGAREGRPPYDPALLLRMLLVSFLYNLSERQTEQMVNENIPMKFFVGLAVRCERHLVSYLVLCSSTTLSFHCGTVYGTISRNPTPRGRPISHPALPTWKTVAAPAIS